MNSREFIVGTEYVFNPRFPEARAVCIEKGDNRVTMSLLADYAGLLAGHTWSFNHCDTCFVAVCTPGQADSIFVEDGDV